MKKQPVTMAMFETEHSSHAVVDWYNILHDVCAQYFIDHRLYSIHLSIQEFIIIIQIIIIIII